MSYSFYTKKDDPFNFSYLNAAVNAYSDPSPKVTVSSAPAPAPTPKPTPTATTVPNTSGVTTNLAAANNNLTDFYRQQQESATTLAKSQQERDAAFAEQQRQRLTEQNNLSGEAYAKQLADQDAQLADTNTQIDTQVGEQNLNEVKTGREGQNALQRMFAKLGTIDSGVFNRMASRKQENLERNMAKNQQTGMLDKRAAARTATQNKDTIRMAQLNEVNKFKEALALIDQNIQKGTDAYNAAVKAAYDKAQESMLKIQSDFASKEADYLFKAKEAGIKDASTSQSAEANKGAALKLVNSLLGGNYQAISGIVQPGKFMAQFIPGAAQARTDYTGIQNLLTLAKRGELKGSGQVSDFETKMLEKAAMAGLDTSLPTPMFLERLKALQADLMAGGAASSGGGMVVQAPDGQQIQIVD